MAFAQLHTEEDKIKWIYQVRSHTDDLTGLAMGRIYYHSQRKTTLLGKVLGRFNFTLSKIQVSFISVVYYSRAIKLEKLDKNYGR